MYIVQERLEENDKEFKVLTSPPNSPDHNPDNRASLSGLILSLRYCLCGVLNILPRFERVSSGFSGAHGSAMNGVSQPEKVKGSTRGSDSSANRQCWDLNS